MSIYNHAHNIIIHHRANVQLKSLVFTKVHNLFLRLLYYAQFAFWVWLGCTNILLYVALYTNFPPQSGPRWKKKNSNRLLLASRRHEASRRRKHAGGGTLQKFENHRLGVIGLKSFRTSLVHPSKISFVHTGVIECSYCAHYKGNTSQSSKMVISR